MQQIFKEHQFTTWANDQLINISQQLNYVHTVVANINAQYPHATACSQFLKQTYLAVVIISSELGKSVIRKDRLKINDGYDIVDRPRQEYRLFKYHGAKHNIINYTHIASFCTFLQY